MSSRSISRFLIVKQQAVTNSVKHHVILHDLRRQIVAGALAPGKRLPTRRQMSEQFAAGPMTVQRALDRLQRDGFVVSRGTLGTFVAQDAPHLCRYAVVFHDYPQGSLYTSALVEAAQFAVSRAY